MMKSVALESMCSLICDCHHSTPEWTEDGALVIRTNNVRNGRLDLQTPSYTSESTYLERTKRAIPNPGDLLITREAPMGEVCLIPDGIRCCLGQRMVLLRPDSQTALGNYLLYALQSPLARRQITLHNGQGSTVSNLRIPVLEGLQIPAPPLPEQRKIADILTTWDEAIEKLDALIAAKERRKKALMQQLLTGRKRIPGYAKAAWKKVRMSEVLARVFRPIEWTPEMPLSLVSLRRRCGGLFRRADMLGADYKTQDLHELRANDFLISKRQVAHGAWAMVTPEFSGCHVSKEYAILVNQAPTKLDMGFFAWLAQTPRMIRLSRVASTGVHIEKLIFDPDVFLRDSIRIPSGLAEQQKIANILDSSTQELTLLRTQRTAIDQQKRGLMQRLLTGKLRVKL